MNHLLPRLLAACGGFLVAVLWMDLMFDVQTRSTATAASLPAPVLASIAAYYRRVTTDAHPMEWLIGGIMVTTLVCGVLDLRSRGGWRRTAALLLAAAPIALAATRVLPNAVALGQEAGDLATQSTLASGIYRDHLACLVAMAASTLLRILD